MPIVRRLDIRLTSAERERVASIAGAMRANEPGLHPEDVFGERVSSGMTDGPALFYEDPSEVPLLGRFALPGVAYRTMLLAGDGDFFAFEGPRNEAFEQYVRHTLGLGAPVVIAPGRPVEFATQPMATRCRLDPRTLSRLVTAARDAGCFSVIPYLGSGSAWLLGSAIAEQAGVEVRVASPPPRLTRRVNDKLWFARVVKALLGSQALPPTYSVFGPAGLAGRVAKLARQNDCVVVKVPDSAGSAGNLVLDSSGILPLSLAELRLQLISLLLAAGWRDTYPVAVGVWEQPALGSPSLQYWIPDPCDGEPVFEGLFQQVLAGKASGFVGAVPSELPVSWRDRLQCESMQLANLLQHLGYFGRCSFDALLTGTDLGSANLHWIECNGRWGGVSIPMSAANRLIGDWSRRPFVIVHRSGLRARQRPFEQALAMLDECLLKPPHRDEGVVVLSPGGIEQGNGLHFMVLAATSGAARQLADDSVTRLLVPGEHGSSVVARR